MPKKNKARYCILVRLELYSDSCRPGPRDLPPNPTVCAFPGFTGAWCSPTFEGAASLLSAVTHLAWAILVLPRKWRHFLGNTRIAQEVASLYGKYRDTSAMAVASLQRGSFVQQRRKNSSKYATRHPWATNRLTLGFYGHYGLFHSVINYTALGLRPRAVPRVTARNALEPKCLRSVRPRYIYIVSRIHHNMGVATSPNVLTCTHSG